MKNDAVLIKLFSKKKPAVFLLFALYTTTATLGSTALGYFKFVIEGYDLILEHIVDFDEGVLITSFAISPFTSIIDPEVLEKRLQNVSNVTIDYYFITLGYVYNKPVVIVGSPLIEEDCAIVETGTYYELVESGYTSIPILSPFTDETVFLRICGKSGKPYILVNHATAAKLRGIPSRYYTMAVVKPNVPNSLDQVLKALNVEPISRGFLLKAIALLEKASGNVTSKVYTTLSEVYFTRMGINKEYFVYFASSVIAVLLIGMPLIGYGVLTHMEHVLKVLRTVGVSKSCILKALCTCMVLSLVPALLVAYLILNVVPSVEVLGFALTAMPSPQDVALICVFAYLLSIIGTVWGLKSEIE